MQSLSLYTVPYIIVAFAAFVTPPDPISQIFLGAAMFGLYGLSILAVKLVEPKGEE